MTYRLSFSSLGGLGEIGLNSYLYCNFNNTTSEYLLVDFGMGFKDNRLTSMDIFFPDIMFFLENNIRPKALVITHGHEDHIGAIPYLISYLNCPIYATAWTADLIKSKLKEHNLDNKVDIIIVEPNRQYNISTFKVKWVPVYHSIIECSLLVIDTPLGKVAHSGDFKMKLSDTEMCNTLSNLYKENIEYLICDSTNIFEEGISGEETLIEKDLHHIIMQAKGATWISLFSSNLERIRLIAELAKKLKKRIVLYGRSLNLYVSLGIKHGFFDPNFFITEEEAKKIERNKLIILATGSQGEERSVMYNVIIRNEYKDKLQQNDIVVFSAKIIQGNEDKVLKYYNTLADMNIQYYTANDYNIHVSGHAKQEELKMIYDFVKPKCIIPMHGEIMHLRKHVEFARSLGFESEMFRCGEVVELFSDKLKIIDKINVGKLTYDGNRVISFNEDFIKVRTKLFFEGSVFLSISIDSKYAIRNFNIDTLGLLCETEKDNIVRMIENKITNYLLSARYDATKKEDTIKEDIRVIIRKIFKDAINKKPIVVVHLSI